MLFVLFGLVVAAGAGCPRGNGSKLDAVADRRASQVRSAAVDGGLPPPVGDVLATAARAPSATFSAVYSGGGIDGSVVVHQRPPQRRVDVVDARGRTVSAFVIDGDEALRCERERRAWRCSEDDDDGAAPPSLGAFDPALLDRTVSALAASEIAVTVERVRIAGTAASCVVSGPDDRFCVSPSGVPLLVQRADGTLALRATTYRRSVADDDLRRPDS